MAEVSGFQAVRATYANRNFRLYASGNLLANIGLWVQRLAIGWLTWELTQSTIWLGGIALAEMIPSLLLSVGAGAVVDRVDYFKLLRWTQYFTLGYAVAIAALSFAGLIGIWPLFALTLLRGFILAFNRPSRLTLVYALVGRDLLPSALAVNSLVWNVSRFIGPALGGVIITMGGAAWSFAFAAVLFFIFSLMLGAMRVAPQMSGGARGSIRSETVEGLRYVWRHQSIRLQLIALIAVSLLAKPLTDMLPGFSGQVFDLGAYGLAILLTVHGLGSVAGALYIAGRKRGLAGLNSISVWSVLGIALSLAAFLTTDIFWIACPLVGAVSFNFTVQNVSNQTLIQSAIEPSLRGRVMSLYGLIVEAVPSIGSLMVGGLAEHWGLRWPLLCGAGICLLVWGWVWRNRAKLEDMARPA